MMQARERLWLTADKKRLVGEGDPKAATLYAAVGDEIPEGAAKRFGLVDGRLEGSKEKTSPENKERKGGGDKVSKPGPTGEPKPAPKTGGLTINKRAKG